MVGFASVSFGVRRKHETAVEPSIADELECAHVLWDEKGLTVGMIAILEIGSTLDKAPEVYKLPSLRMSGNHTRGRVPQEPLDIIVQILPWWMS